MAEERETDLMEVRARFGGDYKDRGRILARLRALGSEYLAELANFRYIRREKEFKAIWVCPAETYKDLMMALKARRIGQFE